MLSSKPSALSTSVYASPHLVSHQRVLHDWYRYIQYPAISQTTKSMASATELSPHVSSTASYTGNWYQQRPSVNSFRMAKIKNFGISNRLPSTPPQPPASANFGFSIRPSTAAAASHQALQHLASASIFPPVSQLTASLTNVQLQIPAFSPSHYLPPTSAALGLTLRPISAPIAHRQPLQRTSLANKFPCYSRHLPTPAALHLSNRFHSALIACHQLLRLSEPSSVLLHSRHLPPTSATPGFKFRSSRAHVAYHQLLQRTAPAPVFISLPSLTTSLRSFLHQQPFTNHFFCLSPTCATLASSARLSPTSVPHHQSLHLLDPDCVSSPLMSLTSDLGRTWLHCWFYPLPALITNLCNAQLQQL